MPPPQYLIGWPFQHPHVREALPNTRESGLCNMMANLDLSEREMGTLPRDGSQSAQQMALDLVVYLEAHIMSAALTRTESCIPRGDFWGFFFFWDEEERIRACLLPVGDGARPLNISSPGPRQSEFVIGLPTVDGMSSTSARSAISRYSARKKEGTLIQIVVVIMKCLVRCER